MSEMICDMNCLECKYGDDCINDSFTLEDYHFSQSLDKEIAKEYIPSNLLRKRQSALAWYHRNRTSIMIKKAKYREENREHLREQSKQYHAEHREQENQRHLANYYSNHEENKKKSRDAKRARYNANPEYYRQKQREYRQRVKERNKKQSESSKD